MNFIIIKSFLQLRNHVQAVLPSIDYKLIIVYRILYVCLCAPPQLMRDNYYVVNLDLCFGILQILRVLEIPIIDDMDPEKDECFEIELFEPTGGARVGNINRVAVTITNDDGEFLFLFCISNIVQLICL